MNTANSVVAFSGFGAKSVFASLPKYEIRVGERSFMLPNDKALIELKDKTAATLPDEKKKQFDELFGGLFHLIASAQIHISRAIDARIAKDERGHTFHLEQATEDLEVAALRAKKIEGRYFLEATANPS